VIEHPNNVQIETISACNAHCSFCPHSAMDPRPKRMETDDFIALLGEMADWEHPPSQICPFLTNEPFADARMPLFVKLINYYLPNAHVVFYTNGSLFSDKTIEKLKSSTVAEITISFHHGNKADYEQELGIQFEKTVASMHRIIAAQICPVKILRVTDGDPKKDAGFHSFCASEFPGTPAGCAGRFNWKGDIQTSVDLESTLDIICPRHTSLCVLVDGRVALCCMDQNGQYSLGQTKQRKMLDIYNSDEALRYRQNVKRASEPCNRCTMR